GIPAILACLRRWPQRPLFASEGLRLQQPFSVPHPSRYTRPFLWPCPRAFVEPSFAATPADVKREQQTSGKEHMKETRIAETDRTKSGHAKMRPRARLIALLGDELISDEPVAVVELVKNSYDADATRVVVRFEGENPLVPDRLVISDD